MVRTHNSGHYVRAGYAGCRFRVKTAEVKNHKRKQYSEGEHFKCYCTQNDAHRDWMLRVLLQGHRYGRVTEVNQRNCCTRGKQLSMCTADGRQMRKLVRLFRMRPGTRCDIKRMVAGNIGLTSVVCHDGIFFIQMRQNGIKKRNDTLPRWCYLVSCSPAQSDSLSAFWHQKPETKIRMNLNDITQLLGKSKQHSK